MKPPPPPPPRAASVAALECLGTLALTRALLNHRNGVIGEDLNEMDYTGHAVTHRLPFWRCMEGFELAGAYVCFVVAFLQPEACLTGYANLKWGVLLSVQVSWKHGGV